MLLPEPVVLLYGIVDKFLREMPYETNSNMKYNLYVIYKLEFVDVLSEMCFRNRNDIYRLHISSNITIWPYVVFMPK